MVGIKKRVLVVDDEKIVCDFLGRFFSSLGVDVKVAENGFKAVELTSLNAFDMYFLDCRMPGMDGLETLCEIRKIHSEAKIVMITGYEMEEMLNKAKEKGAVAVIHKPFDISQLTDVFLNIAGEKQSAPKNILVVDDDPAILIFFSNLLSNCEQKYKVARNKKEAVDALKKETFDLIFLDLVLEDGAGVEVYKEIKDASINTEIVVITGYRDKAKEATQEMKLLGCLFKPFGISEIISYIEKVKK